MSAKNFNLKIFTKILKIVLAIGLYIVFTLYTVPVYHNVKAYVSEKVSANKKIIVGGKWVDVEIVDTEEKRIQGLSGREQLDVDTGMLFVFDTPDFHGIWMKDMNFNIDIVWVNAEYEIVHLVEDATPESYPKVFTPPQKSLYVLELPAGFIKSSGIALGDKLDLY